MKLNLCALNCVTWKLEQRFLRWQSQRNSHQVWNSVPQFQCSSWIWNATVGHLRFIITIIIIYLFILYVLICDSLRMYIIV